MFLLIPKWLLNKTLVLWVHPEQKFLLSIKPLFPSFVRSLNCTCSSSSITDSFKNTLFTVFYFKNNVFSLHQLVDHPHIPYLLNHFSHLCSSVRFCYINGPLMLAFFSWTFFNHPFQSGFHLYHVLFCSQDYHTVFVQYSVSILTNFS